MALDPADLTNGLLGVMAALVTVFSALLGFVLSTVSGMRGEVRSLSVRVDDRFDRLTDRIDRLVDGAPAAEERTAAAAPGEQRGRRRNRTTPPSRPADG